LSCTDNDNFARQQTYANALKEIRTNGPFAMDSPLAEIYHDEETGTKVIAFKGFKRFSNETEALNFLFPNGWDTPEFEKRAILCATNEITNEWNKKIQQDLNPQEAVRLLSANEFEDADDPYGHLQSMLNSDTLQYYDAPRIPKHEIFLKPNDICFLLRNISKRDKLSKNTRIRILHIKKFRLTVQSLSTNKTFSIPRINFKISHYSGFTLVRTQFPIELAYAMTKNKAQGQSLTWELNDIRRSSFSHGQEYVAFSRATNFDQIAVFCNENQIEDDYVLFSNIVYNELFN
jgi:ATP-dependent DNA helicase PIF1